MRLQGFRDRLPPRVRTGLDLAVDTVRGAVADRITGLAAEIAFWVVLSVPPILLVAASGASLLDRATGGDIRTQLLTRLEELALQVFRPSTVEAAISPTLDSLLESGTPSVLSLSFVVAVFSASRVLRVVVHAVTIAYLAQTRPTLRHRLVGLGMTLVGLVLGVILIPVIVAGPRLGEIIERRLGVHVGLSEIWAVAYWPVSLVVVTLLIAGLFHYAVPWRTPFRRELPGAALATVVGLVAGTALRGYTSYAFDSEAVYASLAAPLAVLLWVWLQAIALLLGAELNAEVEKRWPVARRVQPRSMGDIRRRAVDRLRRRRPVGAAVRPSNSPTSPPGR